jgi:hypothetical protein
MKGYMRDSFVGALGRVEAQTYLRFKTAIGGVPSSLHEDGADGRVVAGLLSVDEVIVDEALISLAENGVEGLVHLNIRVGASQSKGYYILESSLGVSLLGSSFKKLGGVAERLAEQAEV